MTKSAIVLYLSRFNSATAAEPWRCGRHIGTPGSLATASIRPRLRSRGDLSQRFGLSPSDRALQFGHGCGAVEIHPRRQTMCAWNALQFGHGCGAVEMATSKPAKRPKRPALQFGHGCGAVEMGNGSDSSATRERMLQFGHGCGAVEIRVPRPQNPAGYRASIRPRLRSRGDSVRTARRHLAAGLLQFGHGCGAVEISWTARNRRRARKGFNSATAAEPWRSHPRLLRQPGSTRLQFGHGCGAVEMEVEAARSPEQPSLQFGHGCGAVEMLTFLTELISAPITELQFGHGCGAVEMTRRNLY